jgi:hypothetical protein
LQAPIAGFEFHEIDSRRPETGAIPPLIPRFLQHERVCSFNLYTQTIFANSIYLQAHTQNEKQFTENDDEEYEKMFADGYDLYDEKFNAWCTLKGFPIRTPHPPKALQVRI